jgi:hypothetical protein
MNRNMGMRICVGLMLVVVVGCGTTTAPDETKQLAAQSSKKDPATTALQIESSSKKGPSSAAQEVTLHVPDMAQRLGID